MAGNSQNGVFAAPGSDNPLAYAVAERDKHTLQMVRDAIASQKVIMAYQPIVPTVNPTKPAFWEGLIRVMDHTGRVIPAKDFIDAIETTELGRQVDCIALDLGMRTLARQPELRLSINMSARSIGYPRWLDVLNKGLSRDPSIAERLILEVTESSAIVVPDIVQVFMSDMQQKGICFALDDFGAGYTALRYLRQFYFDILKIDGQFIKNIHSDPDNQVLTEAMVSIGRHFEMFSVAEVVETREEAQFLAKIGVDCMQGYYFGAPTVRPAWGNSGESKEAG